MPLATEQQREVSPIPPGRYWMRVLGELNQKDFSQWVRDMHGGVQIESSSFDQSTRPTSSFVIFRVPEGRFPFLSAAQFGFPNFAPPEVQSVQDVESPATLTPFEKLVNKTSDLDPSLPSLPAIGAGIVLLILLALSNK